MIRTRMKSKMNKFHLKLKHTILIILISLTCSCSFHVQAAQNTPADIQAVNQESAHRESLFDIYLEQFYTGRSGQTLVRISESMIVSIRSEVSDPTWNDIFSRLSGINIYMAKSPTFFPDFIQVKNQHNFAYEEMMHITRGREKYILLAQKNLNNISELLLVYQKDNQGGIISLQGSMTQQDLETFRKGINTENLEGVPGLNGWN